MSNYHLGLSLFLGVVHGLGLGENIKTPQTHGSYLICWSVSTAETKQASLLLDKICDTSKENQL